VADIQSGDLITALDEASLSRYHLRAVVASGVGFFTDAYDLFVIGIASAPQPEPAGAAGTEM
jgi:PHS family inorganic phosphate transporter-like MFS transporter